MTATDFWPNEVPPIGDPRHEAKLRDWLLAELSPEVRAQRVMHRHLDVLLHLAAAELAGRIAGLRNAYATARSTLAAEHPPETVAAALAAISAVGHELTRQAAFVEHINDLRRG